MGTPRACLHEVAGIVRLQHRGRYLYKIRGELAGSCNELAVLDSFERVPTMALEAAFKASKLARKCGIHRF